MSEHAKENTVTRTPGQPGSAGDKAEPQEEKATLPPPGDPVLSNWAGNITFNAAHVHTPSSVEELRAIVAGSGSARALGSGHSFNAIADTTGDLVSVAGLPAFVEVDRTAAAVTVGGGLRFAEFTGAVHAAGLALHNLGSLPHISVAGACATGTHGSGVRNGSLASAVRALDMVAADGTIRTLDRGDEEFAGAVVGLGALGIVTKMTLDLVPGFEIEQRVYEGLPYARLRERFDEVLSGAYSVSLFTRWRSDQLEQVWVKRRVGDELPVGPPGEWFGAVLANGPRHPVPGMDPAFCTEQGGAAGPWHERLPHFKAEFIPSSGEELQSEYFVARQDAPAAFEALAGIRERIAPVLHISEIRAVAADGLWLSPSYGRDSVAFHFTWLPDVAAVAPVVGAVEDALAPFGARPHWGKVFSTAPERVRELYPRYADFEALRARLDPDGVFSNEWLERYLPRGTSPA